MSRIVGVSLKMYLGVDETRRWLERVAELSRESVLTEISAAPARVPRRASDRGEATSDVGAQPNRLRAVMACEVEDVEVVERRQQERFL